MTRTWTPPAPSLALLLTLGACGGYDPPVRVELISPSYQADLAACRAGVTAAVDRENAKTALAWVASPVRRPGQLRAGLRACLTEKGYALEG